MVCRVKSRVRTLRFTPTHTERASWVCPSPPPARQAVFGWVHLARAQLSKVTDDIEYDFSANDVAALPAAAAAAAPAGLGGGSRSPAVAGGLPASPRGL
jgi:hypothetical protein